MRLLDRVLERVTVYRFWQMPFAESKLAPIRRHNSLAAARRVLDVGCGPGTNARHFHHADYIGVDSNAGYIAWARRHYGERFVIADVTRNNAQVGTGFDFVLVNSFFHHIATPDARRILSHLATLLTDDGHIHILDLVMPERGGIPRWLAKWDRGEFPRPLAEWRTLFTEAFEPVIFEPYSLGAMGATLWEMVYFKGRRRA